jgi:hypothetical protein
MISDQHKPDAELAEIEQLISDLQDQSGENTALMREHLEAARFYLTGSMPGEYDFTLGLARQVLPDVESHDMQARLAAFLKKKASGVGRSAAGRNAEL